MTRNDDCGCAKHPGHETCTPGCFDYACRRWDVGPGTFRAADVPRAMPSFLPIAYASVTAEDWVMADPDGDADPRMPCCGRRESELHTGDCPSALRQDADDGDVQARAMLDLIAQREADDNETGSDGAEL